MSNTVVNDNNPLLWLPSVTVDCFEGHFSSSAEFLSKAVVKTGRVRDLLPALSDTERSLSETWLDKNIPEIFARMVVGEYLTLAERDDGYVSTDDLMWSIEESLISFCSEFFANNFDEFFCDEYCDKLRISLEEDPDSEEYYVAEGDMIQGMFEYGGDFYQWDMTVRAIQEIEGLMTYDYNQDHAMFDIVAPVQCGVMDLSDNVRKKHTDWM